MRPAFARSLWERRDRARTGPGPEPVKGFHVGRGEGARTLFSRPTQKNFPNAFDMRNECVHNLKSSLEGCPSG